MDEVYFKLKRPDQREDFIRILSRERIPYFYFYNNYFSIQQKFVEVLLKEEIEMEIGPNPINIGELSLEVRNRIKENFQKQIVLNREKEREKLKALVGG